jgi:hypothetical protein
MSKAAISPYFDNSEVNTDRVRLGVYAYTSSQMMCCQPNPNTPTAEHRPVQLLERRLGDLRRGHLNEPVAQRALHPQVPDYLDLDNFADGGETVDDFGFRAEPGQVSEEEGAVDFVIVVSCTPTLHASRGSRKIVRICGPHLSYPFIFPVLCACRVSFSVRLLLTVLTRFYLYLSPPR